jgi:hypothetical protein
MARSHGMQRWQDASVLRLQVAFASSTGDFKRPVHYTGVEYLKWQDIELVAKGSSVADPRLVMLATLLHQISHKRVTPNNSIRRLSLPPNLRIEASPCYNQACIEALFDPVGSSSDLDRPR